MEILMFLTAGLGGFVQGLAGFGAGILMMTVLPIFYSIPEGAALSGAISFVLCTMLTFNYRKHINYRVVFFAAAICFAVSLVSINMSVSADQDVLKRIFGVFLVILCIYYLFINPRHKSKNKKMSRPAAFALIFVSAVCDGFFGIGGPLSVIYFLSETKDTKEYLGSIQFYFFVKLIWMTAFRLYKGIIVVEHAPALIAGGIGILIGGFLANRCIGMINPDRLKQITYIMIGVSGVLNIIE